MIYGSGCEKLGRAVAAYVYSFPNPFNDVFFQWFLYNISVPSLLDSYSRYIGVLFTFCAQIKIGVFSGQHPLKLSLYNYCGHFLIRTLLSIIN